MKKLLAISLVMILAISLLTACGGNDNNGSNPTGGNNNGGGNANPVSDFTYTVLEDGSIMIQEYKGKDANVVIPAQIDGKDVSRIGNNAFSGNRTVKSVVIPGTVAEIGSNVFDGCPVLASVTIPDSVTEIGFEAFANCPLLSESTKQKVLQIDPEAVF